MATRTSKYRWVFYVVSPVLSVALTLLLVELGLALFYPAPFSIEHNMYYEADPSVGYKLKPNSVGHFQHGIVAGVNAYGHRDDPPVANGAGLCRLLVLGDSLTMGSNVELEEVYPQVLERMLNDRLAFPVEVINTGVGGWSPFQYAQYYEHYGRGFDHEVVVVGFFVGNDAYSQQTTIEQGPTAIAGRRVSRQAASSRLARFRVFLHEHSHLARFVGRRTPLGLTRTRAHCEDFSEAFIAVQRSRFVNHLPLGPEQRRSAQNSLAQVLHIKKLAEERSIPLVVALLPDENQINHGLQEVIVGPNGLDNYDFRMPQALLIELFADNDVDVIDLLPWFQEDRRCLYMNDTHWTPDGHRLAADVLFEHLAPLLASACGRD